MPDPFTPAVAFRFAVSLQGAPEGQDDAFVEVDGLSVERAYEEVAEGGENRFAHSLPQRARAQNVVLKRGVLGGRSPLRTWCVETLESDFARPIEPKTLDIFLLDANGDPLMTWSAINAWPTRMSLGPLDAARNAYAVETLEFSVARLVQRPA